MIPKTIHYCWFGRGQKSKLANKCISSWRKFMPSYEIVEWNEDSFDICLNEYTKMCYQQKKWAFLSDYVRLYVVNEYGGIYFDTDVEVIKPFDDLLDCESFFGFETTGLETYGQNGDSIGYVASGLGFGSVENGIAIRTMLEGYLEVIDGQHGTVGCPILNTKALMKIGLTPNGMYQKFEWGQVFPTEYFNPMNSATGEIVVTKNTYSIHRYSMSWLPKSKQLKTNAARIVRRLFGVNCFDRLKK